MANVKSIQEAIKVLNFRKIDKFYLSGGWNNLPDNISLLRANRIKAVLDLQFTPDGGIYENYSAAIAAIKAKLAEDNIEYRAIRMRDDEFNADFDGVLSEGTEFLTEMEEKYPEKRDGILVKCGAGISRSSTMLINHLCITRRMSYLEALAYLRKREEDQAIQFGSSPNQFFAEKLKKRFK